MPTESGNPAEGKDGNGFLAADLRFRGKTIIITGAGGNFGRAGCLYFALRGAKVAALDNNREALDETIARVEGTSTCPEIQSYACDITNTESVNETIEAIVKRSGKIDLLWNNAGYQGQIKPTLQYDPTDFANVMNINVTGMFIVLQAVAKRMAASHDCDEAAANATGHASPTNTHPYSIVNTSSVAALRGTPAMIAYAASKAAILAMTVSAAKDLAPHGIRVNAISPALIGPGFMWTRQNELHAASGSPYFSNDPEAVAQNKVGSVPMKRLGTIEEVIQSVAYLLSEDSSYTTGTNLVVDGGMSAGLK